MAGASRAAVAGLSQAGGVSGLQARAWAVPRCGLRWIRSSPLAGAWLARIAPSPGGGVCGWAGEMQAQRRPWGCVMPRSALQRRPSLPFIVFIAGGAHRLGASWSPDAPHPGLSPPLRQHPWGRPLAVSILCLFSASFKFFSSRGCFTRLGF